MAEGNQTSIGQQAVATLSAEEQRALANAIARIEARLFESVLKRLKQALWIIGGIVVFVGAGAAITVRSAVIDVAANRLAADSRVRDEVVAATAQNLETVNAVLRRAQELESRIDSEQQKALAVLNVDLEQLLKMVEQLRGELAALRGTP